MGQTRTDGGWNRIESASCRRRQSVDGVVGRKGHYWRIDKEDPKEGSGDIVRPQRQLVAVIGREGAREKLPSAKK